MSDIEDVNKTLRSVKAKATTAAETGHTSVRLTLEFLGYLAAAVESLDGFSAALPSEETLDALVGHVATARDETLDAYSILQKHKGANKHLLYAADQAEDSLEALAAPDPTKFRAGPSASADAEQLRAGIGQLYRHIAELRALAIETDDMYQIMGGSVQHAIEEGDAAITKITVFQHEMGMGE